MACLGIQHGMEDSLVSMSFDQPLSTEKWPVVLQLLGYTFAPDAEVPLLDYIDSDLQLKPEKF